MSAIATGNRTRSMPPQHVNFNAAYGTTQPMHTSVTPTAICKIVSNSVTTISLAPIMYSSHSCEGTNSFKLIMVVKLLEKHSAHKVGGGASVTPTARESVLDQQRLHIGRRNAG
mmetsp:Transcript_55230/g.81932  ORF Transcript_55230/g.81932 Transcript_55230/m.81932 type:complete len:114 (-) Transcript_55230:22-363(-)